MFALFYAEDTRLVHVWRRGCWEDAVFKTHGACVQALIRHVQKRPEEASKTFVILPYEDFRKVQLFVTRYNLMSGKPFQTSINTPACCDPSTETYWSM